MDWFFYAALARLLWASSGLAAHYMNRHFRGKSMFSPVILAHGFLLPCLVLTALIAGVPALPPTEILFWIVAGAAFFLLGQPFYHQAMQKDRAQNITPLFEMTPVCVIFLGLILLDESMTSLQAILGFGAIVCSFLFAWDFEKGELKRTTFLLMLMTCLCYGSGQIVLRHVTTSVDPYAVLFYTFVATFVFAGIVALCLPRASGDAWQAVRTQKADVLVPAFLSEGISFLGASCLIYAYATGPTAGHVAVLSALQPVFVFLLAPFAARLMPHHFNPLVFNRDFGFKMILLVVLLACTMGLRLV